MMIVRISSRLGVTKVSTHPNHTLQDFKNLIQDLLSIPSEHQQLSIRHAPQEMGILKLDDPNTTLKILGIRQGDTVFLQAPETTLNPLELDDHLGKSNGTQTNQALSLSSKSSTMPTQSFSSSHQYASSNVQEDEVDILLHAVDGWAQRPRTSRCQHPLSGRCCECMPVPPWNIENHDDLKEFNLKHISFHAWLREKQYRSLNNPIFLEDPVWRHVNTSQQLSARDTAFSIVLERQVYRHVDHIEFESPQLIDQFIEGWRSTGLQRCGYLYGRYIVDPSGIPLGIQANVVAIYEPPQQATIDEVVFLKNPDEDTVHQLAKSLGLALVGMIWTSLKNNANHVLASDRSTSTYLLKSKECIRMCAFQNRFPSPCRQSNSGWFGSKFVSILIHANEEGDIDISAYQMSNQFARLARDGVIKSTRENLELLRVKSSKKDIVYPDVFYSERDEYNNLVQCKANPTFPNIFGIVSIRNSFPKEPQPTFKTFAFPIENRIVYPKIMPSLSTLKQQLKKNWPECLIDWHLIIYLNKMLKENDSSMTMMKEVLNLVNDKGKFSDKSSSYNLQSKLLQLASSNANQDDPGQISPTTSSGYMDICHSPVSADFIPYSPASPPSSQIEDMVKTIREIGFPEDQIRQALVATDYVSIEAAIDLLTS